MFCARCGKTLPPKSDACPACGMTLSSTDFSAVSYIATQPLLPEGQVTPVVSPRYTKTTYTTLPDPGEEEDILRRTAYRPTFQKEEAPAPPPTEAKSAEEAPAPSAPTGDIDSLPANMRFRPLTPVSPAGISSRMVQRMRKAEEEAAARQEADAAAEGDHKPARPTVSGIFSAIGRGAKTLVPKREVFTEEETEEASSQIGEEDPVYEAYEEEDEVFDTSDLEDFSEEEPRQRLFSFRRGDTPPLSTGAKVARGLIIAGCILALLLAGFLWLSVQTAARSPIQGVTYSLHERCIDLLESHTTREYREELSALYAADPTGSTVLQRQSADQAAFLALMPGTPLSNDAAFMETVLSVQANIDMAVTLDALDALSGQTGITPASAARWNTVQAAVKRLKGVKSIEEFASVTAQANVSATPTPVPTATPTPYTTLTKGMKDSAEVKALQNRLYELGWFTDVRDGDFGPATQSAVKLFQQQSGLTVTGIADPETLSAIYAEGALRTGTRITPQPDTAAAEGGASPETAATAVPTIEPTSAPAPDPLF